MRVLDVKKKVAQNTVRDARELMGFSDAQIAAVTGAHRRTVQRWVHRTSAPQPQHQAALEQIRELVHLLRTVFRTPGAALQWFHAPVPMLRGRTPASLVERGLASEVIEVLAGLAEGAHA